MVPRARGVVAGGEERRVPRVLRADVRRPAARRRVGEAARLMPARTHGAGVTRVEKPWGWELWWAHTERYVGKILHINRGGALSYQFHREKDETIYVLRGTLEIELARGGGRRRRRLLGPGDGAADQAGRSSSDDGDQRLRRPRGVDARGARRRAPRRSLRPRRGDLGDRDGRRRAIAAGARRRRGIEPAPDRGRAPRARTEAERVMTARRALITGITGQDGSYLAEFLLGQGLRGLRHGAALEHRELRAHRADPRLASRWCRRTCSTRSR